LPRFELSRLEYRIPYRDDDARRISLATLPRYARGKGVRTYIYCQPRAGGRIRSQGNQMLLLRRRNHEGAEAWVVYEAYEEKNKREKLRLSYVCVCVFYYCSTYYKAVRVGGGGEWRTCAMVLYFAAKRKTLFLYL
jgi:hypothetical protein